jgi:RNA polymerase sigma factor (sigma-70 family)
VPVVKRPFLFSKGRGSTVEQNDQQDDRELKIVRSITNSLILKVPSLKREREDIEQILLMRIPGIRKKYLPGSKASFYTYLYKALNRIAFNILRDRKRHKRVIDIRVVSLSARIGADSELTIADTISDNQSEAALLENISLKEKINIALNKLSPSQYDIALLLGEGLKKTDIARHINKPRTTINDEIKRILKIFRYEGLEEYLR